MSYIEDVAALAHNNTKEDGIPLFNDCQFDFKQKCVAHAETVQRSGLAGNDSPTDFEKEVARLLAEPDKTEAAIRKARVDAANAAADAAQERAKAVAASAAAEAKAATADAKADAKAAKEDKK